MQILALAGGASGQLGFRGHELGKIQGIIEANQAQLLQAWESIHG